jgi:hypothetical protein
MWGFGKMTFPVQFRFDDDQLRVLDERARAEGITRAAFLRSIVSEALSDKPELNVARLNQITEYSQAALAALVQHFLGDKQTDIIAVTAERLEQFHGQK